MKRPNIEFRQRHRGDDRDEFRSQFLEFASDGGIGLGHRVSLGMSVFLVVVCEDYRCDEIAARLRGPSEPSEPDVFGD